MICVVFVQLVFSDSTTDCYDVKELYEMIQRQQAQLDAVTERGLCFKQPNLVAIPFVRIRIRNCIPIFLSKW